jgi:hypothetical protein
VAQFTFDPERKQTKLPAGQRGSARALASADAIEASAKIASRLARYFSLDRREVVQVGNQTMTCDAVDGSTRSQDKGKSEARFPAPFVRLQPLERE